MTINNIYYNGLYTNIQQGSQPALFSTTFSQPLVNKANDYEMSIIKFSLPGNNIPLFIFQPNTYQVSISYDLNFYTEYVNFIPTNTFPSSDPRYYYCWSYNLFIEMINIAIFNVWTTFKTDNPSVTSNYAPYLIYDAPTELITLYSESAVFGESISNGCQLFFNSVLFNFFQSFPYIYYPIGIFSESPDPNKEWNQIWIQSNGENKITSLSPPTYLTYGSTPSNIAGYSTIQEYACLWAWNVAQSIVITSSTLPTRAESLPSQGSNKGYPNLKSIITDYTLAVSSGPDIRSRITYLPTAEYRWCDLLSSNPIAQLDFQIYWLDNLQNFYPLYVNTNDSVNIKFLFRKKST